MSNKFFARKFIDANGNKWDSKKEYERFDYLYGLQEFAVEGMANLDRQVRFLLIPKHKCLLDEKAERPVFYTCDFIYTIYSTLYIEDVKSDYTRKEKDYILRRKLFKWIYLNKDDPEFKKLHEALPNIEFKNAQFVEVL